MKVLIYFQDKKAISTSGIGMAERHQLAALKDAGVECTLDPLDTYDIAHINTLWNKSRRVLRLCRKKGVPIIVHGHSTHEDFRHSFHGWRFMEPFVDHSINYMYSHADMIITPTAYSRDLIASYKGVKCPVIAISNGIDLVEYAPNPEAQKTFREHFGVKEGEKFVMGVGFPFKRKGLDDFIEVARAFPDTKFFWFGHLPTIAISYPMRRAMAHKPANVILAGYAKGALIKGAYQCASCFFFPSNEETEGIVVLEALASRTPMVVRDIGVYKGWLENGKNCYMGHNNAEFTADIRQILDHGESHEMLEAGYQVAEGRTIPLVGEELRAAYEKLLETKKTSK
jgi:1,2-diacylglycerol-3-alpha-glucose alpha-1,2-glucosyltransferase